MGRPFEMCPDQMGCIHHLIHGTMMQAGAGIIRATSKPQAVMGAYLTQEDFSKWLPGVPAVPETDAPCKTGAETVELRNDLHKVFNLAQAANRKFAKVVDENKRMKEDSRKAEGKIKTLKTLNGRLQARVENLESCLGAERLLQMRWRRGEDG